MRPYILSLFFSLFTCTAYANNPFAQINNQPTLLAPEIAFDIHVFDITPNEIVLDVNIAPGGYYLYRDQFTFYADNTITLGNPIFPEGIQKNDEFFGEQIVYEHNTLITIPVEKNAQQANLTVGYRGCAPIGVCYPPMEKTLILDFPAASPTNNDNVYYTRDILTDQHFLLALAIFLGLGILLAFTPCVLPMLPILSSIILGQKHLSKARAFELSSVYVIALALTFAIAGVCAALVGASLQSFLQTPWVLSFSAAILMILAIILLLDKPLQLPQNLRKNLDEISRKQKGGTVLGVFSMGVLSALVVSPCVTPPLIGALIYIAETGDPYLGAGALFMLGLGMGLPLVLFAIFGAHFLPKSGAWLKGVKIFFALLLIALAFHLIMRFLPGDEVVSVESASPAFPYTLVKTIDDVEKELGEAKAQHQAVILDFYATWCVSCVKMEKTVFPDPAVQGLLSDVRFLKADVTANDADDRALQQHFSVYGPPSIQFFSPDGELQSEFRIDGEIGVVDFVAHLKQWQDR